MAIIVTCDITKKEMIFGKLGHYVKADFIIQDIDADITDVLTKILHVTENVKLSYSDVDQLANSVLVAYRDDLEAKGGV